MTDKLATQIKKLTDGGAELTFTKGKVAVELGKNQDGDEVKKDLSGVLPSGTRVEVEGTDSQTDSSSVIPSKPGGNVIASLQLPSHLLDDADKMDRLLEAIQQVTEEEPRLILTYRTKMRIPQRP